MECWCRKTHGQARLNEGLSRDSVVALARTTRTAVCRDHINCI